MEKKKGSDVMERSTVLHRLEELYKGHKKTVGYYAIRNDFLIGGNKIIRPGRDRLVWYENDWERWKKPTERAEEIIDVLEKLDLQYEVGNDAPRRGMLGRWIKITTKLK